MQELDLAFEESAFSVTFSSCLANYTQTHEFGHSMGSMHTAKTLQFPASTPIPTATAPGTTAGTP